MLPERPDPDRLLDTIKEDEKAAARGKLKIFFGACAGVGKTYAMLQAARQKQSEGNNVLIGIVETHGRAETAVLLDKLPILPSRMLEYKGKTIPEFDVQAALSAHPELIIVDELAHSNLEGSIHVKRWQDVEELLEAGIDVYTALNVQHLDSLNDIVSGITGIKVRETVPDHVFDHADEVSLVDLPPDELLSRLAAGKVYVPDAAARAAKNFFRKGNLIALRELALRRTADRVDAQMRAYREDRAISALWRAKDRLIACVGEGPGGERIVRETARLAAKLQTDWIAVHVDRRESTARHQRRQALDSLKLAEQLGAETATIPGANIVEALASYARSRNATQLVMGRKKRSRFHQHFTGTAEKLAESQPDLTVILIGLGESKPLARTNRNTHGSSSFTDYIWATLACLGTTALAEALLRVFDQANVIMVFLLTVVLVSLRYGRGPGAWAAFLAVACFDFFFVPPLYTITVNDTQYILTFAIMLVVALIIGQLVAMMRFETHVASHRERRATALSNLARELSGALQQEQILEITIRNLETLFQAKIGILLPDRRDRMRVVHGDSLDESVAQWVYDHQQEAGSGTKTLAAATARYLPLKAPMRTRGVLALMPERIDIFQEPEERRLLDACTSQIALALERIHYVEVAQDTLVQMEGERLRNALLAAVSHDLKTPLTAIVGMASTLERDPPHAIRDELVTAVRKEAEQMSRLVTNLLDMARLQTSGVQLRKDWQSIEEVIGSALHQLKHVLAHHRVETSVPSDLPLVEMDAMLIERVFVNLLDNAAKHTPSGSVISISATLSNREIVVTIEDNGPGLPFDDHTKLFDAFTRGEVERTVPGVGIGLALCRIIVEAHGGRITAANKPEGGAQFRFALPATELPKQERE